MFSLTGLLGGIGLPEGSVSKPGLIAIGRLGGRIVSVIGLMGASGPFVTGSPTSFLGGLGGLFTFCFFQLSVLKKKLR